MGTKQGYGKSSTVSLVAEFHEETSSPSGPAPASHSFCAAHSSSVLVKMLHQVLLLLGKNSVGKKSCHVYFKLSWYQLIYTHSINTTADRLPGPLHTMELSWQKPHSRHLRRVVDKSLQAIFSCFKPPSQFKLQSISFLSESRKHYITRYT